MHSQTWREETEAEVRAGGAGLELAGGGGGGGQTEGQWTGAWVLV